MRMLSELMDAVQIAAVFPVDCVPGLLEDVSTLH